MPRYRVVQDYRSGLGEYAAGDVIEVAEDFAAHINRDAPGTLVDADAKPAPEARAEDTPPHDRQVKAARKRGGDG